MPGHPTTPLKHMTKVAGLDEPRELSPDANSLLSISLNHSEQTVLDSQSHIPAAFGDKKALHITVCMKESSTPRTIENPNCAESRERAPQKPTDAHALEHLAHTMFSDATTTVSSMVSPPAIYSHSFPR